MIFDEATTRVASAIDMVSLTRMEDTFKTIDELFETTMLEDEIIDCWKVRLTEGSALRMRIE